MNWAKRFLGKAFSIPTPIEGAALIIPGRHPLQMWITSCLVARTRRVLSRWF